MIKINLVYIKTCSYKQRSKALLNVYGIFTNLPIIYHKSPIHFISFILMPRINKRKLLEVHTKIKLKTQYQLHIQNTLKNKLLKKSSMINLCFKKHICF